MEGELRGEGMKGKGDEGLADGEIRDGGMRDDRVRQDGMKGRLSEEEEGRKEGKKEGSAWKLNLKFTSSTFKLEYSTTFYDSDCAITPSHYI